MDSDCAFHTGFTFPPEMPERRSPVYQEIYNFSTMPTSFKIFGYDAISTLELVNGEDTSIIMLRGALMSASTT